MCTSKVQNDRAIISARRIIDPGLTLAQKTVACRRRKESIILCYFAFTYEHQHYTDGLTHFYRRALLAIGYRTLQRISSNSTPGSDPSHFCQRLYFYLQVKWISQILHRFCIHKLPAFYSADGKFLKTFFPSFSN